MALASTVDGPQSLPANDPIMNPTGTFFTLNHMNGFSVPNNLATNEAVLDTNLDAWLGSMARGEDLHHIFPDGLDTDGFDWNM